MRTQKARFVFLFVLILALVAFPTSVSANHSLGKNHWARQSNPFTLQVGESVSSKDAERYYQGDLTIGVPVTGSLARSEPVHYWGFGGTAGDAVFVELISPEGGDTHLYIYVANGSNWDLIAENEDCQGSLNSCMDVLLPQTGRYLIGATSYQYAWYGRKTAINYELTVHCTNVSGVCGAAAVAEGGN